MIAANLLFAHWSMSTAMGKKVAQGGGHGDHIVETAAFKHFDQRVEVPGVAIFTELNISATFDHFKDKLGRY